jgi:CBS domain-containing protein
MLTLRELMTPTPVTITPGATLREAVDLLTAVGVSALPVVDGDHLVGLLSAQGLIAFEASTPGVPIERDVSDVWDGEPEADDEAPAGEYFTDLWEDAGTDVVERFRASEGPEWDVLAEHTVEEAMTLNPPRLAPTASAMVAAELMRSTGSHGVLVVEHDRLCGIVTTMDITRAFGGRGAGARRG